MLELGGSELVKVADKLENEHRLELSTMKKAGGGGEGEKFRGRFDGRDVFVYAGKSESLRKRQQNWEEMHKDPKLRPYLAEFSEFVQAGNGDLTQEVLITEDWQAQGWELVDSETDWSEIPEKVKGAGRVLREKWQGEHPDEHISRVTDEEFDRKVLELVRALEEGGWRVADDAFFVGVRETGDEDQPFERRIFLGDLGANVDKVQGRGEVESPFDIVSKTYAV